MRSVMVSALVMCPMVGMVHAAQSTPLPQPGTRMAVAADSVKSKPDGLTPWTPVGPAVARSLAEITFINAVALGVNILARDIRSPSPVTWWDNIRGGWEWDPNDIRVNHLEHPWAGAAYFNSARANGLSFWGSVPMALTGSLMWELFGESKPPSTNDLLSTTLTGVGLGEPLRRLSLIVVDEESTGLDRLWREVVVFIGNPGLGLSRLSRGQSWTRRENPPGRRPDAMRGEVAAGARSFARADGTEPIRSPLLGLNVEYGDPFADRTRGPFSFFSAGMEIVTSSPDGLGSLNVRGLLTPLGAGHQAATHRGGIFMDFDYRRDGAVEFAQHSFSIGLLSRTPAGGRFRLATDVSASAVPILAVYDRYSKPLTGRRYDYGAGVGARAHARLELRGRRVLWASGRAYWAPTLDGASETKAVQIANIDARLPLIWSVSLGASYELYRQGSTYDSRQTEAERVSSFSLFLSTGQ